MHSKNAVGFLVREYLDHALKVTSCASAGIGGEGEDSFVELNTGCNKLLFGLPDGGNFRMCVDNSRDGIIVHVTSESSDVLHASYTLLLSLVCEHRTIDSIADSKNRWILCLKVAVDDDTPLLVHFDPHLLKP